MKIIWLGHGSFRIEIGTQVLLVDPWFTDSPVFPAGRKAEAIKGTTGILITHGHFDHTADVVNLSKSLGVPATGPYELMRHFEEIHDLKVNAFNFGGTVKIGDVSVSLVPAKHSSCLKDNPLAYVGSEAGFIIKGEGHCIYLSGDTGIMADMDWIGDFYKPDIGILSAGGHFTMGMAETAYAAKRYFNFDTLIPCHYKTFPLLEQSAQALIEALPEVNVIEPEIMEPITLG
jgi:L-ascorbate metabolism protein UlaG (beta-lactamase superfamily)